jgi:hypothetical protein
MGKCRTPGYAVWTSKLVQAPTCMDRTSRMGSGPPVWGPTTDIRVLRPYLRPKRGSGANTCPDLIW